MDLRQLATLAAIAEHGSFSGAARALFTVQSNVSAHLARLEKELGVTLVDRKLGQLTEAGILVLGRARAIQREVDAVYDDLASLGEDVSGDARLGVIGTTARWLMPQLLTAVRDAHPRVRAIVVEASTTSLLPQLMSGQLDLAVVNLPLDDPDLVADPLFAEDLVVLAAMTHPLAEHDEVTLAELARHRLVLPAPGTALREDLEDEARRAGVTLLPLAEIDGVRLLASLAFEGFGAAIVPATAVPGWLKGPFKRVRVPGLPRRVVGVARRRRSAVGAPARAVQDLLVHVVLTKGPRQPGVHVMTPHEPPPSPAR
jgi:LysR family hydrogen peroxide-inducible transcriptional activator